MTTDLEDPTGDIIEAFRVSAEWIEVTYTDPVAEANPDVVTSHSPRFAHGHVARTLSEVLDLTTQTIHRAIALAGPRWAWLADGPVQVDQVIFEDENVMLVFTPPPSPTVLSQVTMRLAARHAEELVTDLVTTLGELLDEGLAHPSPDEIPLPGR